MVPHQNVVRIPEPIRQVLVILAEKLESSKTGWAVTGSTSLALQGLDIVPNDLDILTDEEGAYSFAKRFRDHAVEPLEWKTSSKYESHLGRFKTNGVQVEVMGDLRVFRGGQWSPVMNPRTRKIVSIEVANRKIPTVSLESQKASGYLEERLRHEKSGNASER